MLAMVMHPEVQRAAQEEIDRVVGNDHLPDYEDQDALPYVSAIVKETLRRALHLNTSHIEEH